MDNLTMDMIACEKAGFGVSYGKWKATQPIREIPKVEVVCEYEKACEHCGKIFEVFTKRERKYCSLNCGVLARYYRKAERKRNEAKKARND